MAKRLFPYLSSLRSQLSSKWHSGRAGDLSLSASCHSLHGRRATHLSSAPRTRAAGLYPRPPLRRRRCPRPWRPLPPDGALCSPPAESLTSPVCSPATKTPPPPQEGSPPPTTASAASSGIEAEAFSGRRTHRLWRTRRGRIRRIRRRRLREHWRGSGGDGGRWEGSCGWASLGRSFSRRPLPEGSKCK